MHVGKKTLKREKSAMTLSLYGSLVFAIVEIGMAVFSGSQAVLLDAVYDSVEFFMMLPSIFGYLIHNSQKNLPYFLRIDNHNNTVKLTFESNSHLVPLLMLKICSYCTFQL